MKAMILTMVATNSGWLARQLIKWAAVVTAMMATWLTAKGWAADESMIWATTISSGVLGTVELALSWVARKYKVPAADAVRFDIDKLRSSGGGLVLAGMCVLLCQCAAVTAFVTSPLGQTALVSAAALGKQLAKATEAQVLQQIILRAEGQILLLEAQGVNADLGKEIVRQSEMTGFQAVVDAAQNQYVGLTGGRFVVPKQPVGSVLP